LKDTLIEVHKDNCYLRSQDLSGKMRTGGSVLLYVPNLIGYARILFMFAAIYYAAKIPGLIKSNSTESDEAILTGEMFIICYLASFIGDVVDGYAARILDQSSKFGGILDMVTDRLATCALLASLCAIYPGEIMFFIFFLMLDVASHWIHTIATKAHHKLEVESTVKRDGIIIYIFQKSINWYYSIYILFGYCCVSAELYWIIRVAQPVISTSFRTQSDLLLQMVQPGMYLKNVVNLAQLSLASYRMAQDDADVFNKSKQKEK